jgi:D-aminopeptidase
MDAIDQLARTHFPAEAPGGAIGVILDGEIRHARGYGRANLDAALPFTGQSVFRACSVSKQFVCLMVRQLEREGRLTLDDHPAKYLSGLAGFDPALTVRHLCQNRSGLRDYWCVAMLAGAGAESRFSLEDGRHLIHVLKRPMFAPGAQYSYCNGNWRILEWIIESVTARSLPALLQERVFSPLAMHHTGWGADTGATLPGDSRGYRRVGPNWETEVTRACWSGDAALITTLDDFLKWEMAMLGPDLTALPCADTLGEAMPHPDGATGLYAFGINAWRKDDRWMHWHSGALRGWRMVHMRFPQDRATIVVMINRTENPLPIALKVAECIGISTTWDAVTAVAPAVATAADKLSGTYYSARLDLLAEVHAAGGQVSLDLGGETVPLLWTGPDTLANSSGFYRLQWRRDALRIHARQFGWRDDFVRMAAGDEARRLAGGCFHSSLLGSTLTFAGDGSTLTISGAAGESEPYAVRPLARGFLAFDCLRALDELPPGRFTIRLLDNGDITVGCFMARGLAFRRT